MKQLRTAGVGVIAVSWYPPQTKDPNAILFVDDLMPLLLNIAQIYSIQVCFHIEPYVDRSAITVKRDIQYIIDTYYCTYVCSVDMEITLLFTDIRTFP